MLAVSSRSIFVFSLPTPFDKEDTLFCRNKHFFVVLRCASLGVTTVLSSQLCSGGYTQATVAFEPRRCVLHSFITINIYLFYSLNRRTSVYTLHYNSARQNIQNSSAFILSFILFTCSFVSSHQPLFYYHYHHHFTKDIQRTRHITPSTCVAFSNKETHLTVTIHHISYDPPARTEAECCPRQLKYCNISVSMWCVLICKLNYYLSRILK